MEFCSEAENQSVRKIGDRISEVTFATHFFDSFDNALERAYLTMEILTLIGHLGARFDTTR